MRRIVIAAAAAAALWPLAARGISVEQIEAWEIDTGDNPNNPTRYAPIDFAGNSSVLETSGTYAGITFHAEDGTATTLSSHAGAVAGIFYGVGTMAYPYVSNVYNAQADLFNQNVVDAQSNVSANGPAPGNFDGGSKIINNSYVVDQGSSGGNLDLLRRLDFMIQKDNVVFVTAAANRSDDPDDTTNYYLDWAAFDSLAVMGTLNGLTASGSPGKPHADVFLPGQTSFATAGVSAYAAGLYGQAQSAGQSDALNDVSIRSLIMTGADAGIYSASTTNHLSTSAGAGQANYGVSLAVLQGGERSLYSVGSGGTISGTPSTALDGWTFGTVAGAGESAVLFQTSGAISSIIAALNWDVTQSQPTSGEINTTTAGDIFPDLTLEVRPVSLVSGHYVLGASLGNASLLSAVGAGTDNVEYLNFSGSLAAGSYAFLISGDPALSTTAGFSYRLVTGGSASLAWYNGGGSGDGIHWDTTSPNWYNGSAVTEYTDGSPVTFDDTNVGHYTITLNGAVSPGSVTVNNSGGNYTITGTGSINGSGGLIKSGSDSLTLGTANGYTGGTNIDQGMMTLTSTGSIADSAITVNPSGTLSLAAGTSGILLRNLHGLTISGGIADVAAAAASSSRSVVVTPSLSISAGGKLDLANNDMIVQGVGATGFSTIFNEIAAAYNGGNWQGTGGITSSSAEASSETATWG